MQIGGGDVAATDEAPSLSALLASGKPVTGYVSEDASNLGELHPDWQDLVRRRALRSIISIPVRGTPGLQGTLTLGCMDAGQWEDQWWYGGMQLLNGWAASALSQHQPASCLDFFEEILQAKNFGQLAAAFVHSLPASLHGEDLGGRVEARLALVSSHLTHALVYAIDPGSIYNSSQELQRIMMTERASMGSSTKHSKQKEHSAQSFLPKANARDKSSSDELTGEIAMQRLPRSDSTCSDDSEDAGREGMEVAGEAAGGDGDSSGGDAVGEKDSVAEAVNRLRRAITSLPEGSGLLQTAPADIFVPSRPANPEAQTSSESASQVEVSVGIEGISGDQSGEVLPLGRLISRSVSSGHRQGSAAVQTAAAIAATIRRIKRRSSVITAAGAAAAGLLHIGDGGSGDIALTRTSASSGSFAFSGSNQQLQQPAPRAATCVSIPTDGTLLMSALEAGDVMTVKDSLVYLGRKRVVSHTCVPREEKSGGSHNFMTVKDSLVYLGRKRVVGHTLVPQEEDSGGSHNAFRMYASTSAANCASYLT